MVFKCFVGGFLGMQTWCDSSSSFGKSRNDHMPKNFNNLYTWNGFTNDFTRHTQTNVIIICL